MKATNNNKELLKYSFAREGSPAFYITYITYNGDTNIILNRNGAHVEVAPYTAELFEQDMQSIQNIVKADEFDVQIDENKIYKIRTITARFWFD